MYIYVYICMHLQVHVHARTILTDVFATPVEFSPTRGTLGSGETVESSSIAGLVARYPRPVVGPSDGSLYDVAVSTEGEER